MGKEKGKKDTFNLCYFTEFEAQHCGCIRTIDSAVNMLRKMGGKKAVIESLRLIKLAKE